MQMEQKGERNKMEAGKNMENKVIAKEYVDKNYISKDYIKKKIKILEKLYKEAGEPAEYNIRSTYLYHKIINYKELLEDK